MPTTVIVPSASTSAMPSSRRRSPSSTAFALVLLWFTAEPSYLSPQCYRCPILNKRAVTGPEITRLGDDLPAAERRHLRLRVDGVLARQPHRDVLEAVERRARGLAELHLRCVEWPVEGRCRADLDVVRGVARAHHVRAHELDAVA